MNKEELDRIFQQGAERYDFEYNPAAWAHMQQLLEEQRRRRWVLWCFWGGFGLLSLILSICFLLGQHHEDPAAEAPANQSPRAHAKEQETVPAEDIAPVSPSPAESPIKPAAQQNDRQKPIAGRTGASNERTGPKIPNVPALPKTEDIDARKSSLPPPGKEAVVENEKKPNTNNGTPWQRESNALPHADNLAFLPGKPNRVEHTRAEIRRDTDAIAGATPIAPANEKRSRLVFSAQIAPNYSSVGINDHLERGGSVGVNAAYLIGSKQIIGLGVELSKKEYLAGGGDYTPPYGFWTRKIAPTETFGRCTILEIPLSFTRYLGPLQRPGGFAQVGLASYLMLRENYYYHYEQSDPDLIRWWGAKNDNQHWLSVVNLSGGFRYPLGEKYALNLGPFLNIPLGGVGHGKVKLYSMGINLGIDFRP